MSDVGPVITGLAAAAGPIEVSSHAPAALAAAIGLGAFGAMLLRRRGTPRGAMPG